MRKKRFSVRKMKRHNRWRFLCGFGMLFLIAGCTKSTQKPPPLLIENVWSWPLQVSNGSKAGHSGRNGVVYLTVINPSHQTDRLLSVQTDVAAKVEMHETRMQGDRMLMQPVVGGMAIPPQSQVEFKPGGAHIMLIGVNRSLLSGDRFEVKLTFQNSGVITVESQVRKL